MTWHSHKLSSQNVCRFNPDCLLYSTHSIPIPISTTMATAFSMSSLRAALPRAGPSKQPLAVRFASTSTSSQSPSPSLQNHTDISSTLPILIISLHPTTYRYHTLYTPTKHPPSTIRYISDRPYQHDPPPDIRSLAKPDQFILTKTPNTPKTRFNPNSNLLYHLFQNHYFQFLWYINGNETQGSRY